MLGGSGSKASRMHSPRSDLLLKIFHSSSIGGEEAPTGLVHAVLRAREAVAEEAAARSAARWDIRA
jgi:hypothetical protein